MSDAQNSRPKLLWRSILCLKNVYPLTFTNEMRCFAAFLIGLGLCGMSFRAGYKITRKVGGGLAAGFGGLMYIYRSLRRFKEGGQLEIETYRDHLKEKRFIVTGGARGLGWAAVLLLCEGGAKNVVLAIRDSEKRRSEILSQYEAFVTTYESSHSCQLPKTTLEFVELDASSKQSAIACADQLKKLHTHYDGILCNAGVSHSPDAIEVNWLNQAILINQLKDRVTRVVTLSSIMHAIGNFKDSLQATKEQPAMIVYGTGKLGMLFEARYLASQNVEAVSAHPGYVYTDMTSFYNFCGFPACLSKSVRSGAMTPVACLINKEVKAGAYYDTLREAPEFMSAQSSEQYNAYLKIREHYFSTQNISTSEQPLN